MPPPDDGGGCCGEGAGRGEGAPRRLSRAGLAPRDAARRQCRREWHPDGRPERGAGRARRRQAAARGDDRATRREPRPDSDARAEPDRSRRTSAPARERAQRRDRRQRLRSESKLAPDRRRPRSIPAAIRALADASDLRDDVARIGSLLDSSSQAVDELAEKTTITDLFAALVRHLAGEFSRVALFRLKANRLEGEDQIGFDETTDVTKLVLPLNVDSLITRAASSGSFEQLIGDDLDDNSRAPFGGTPIVAIAMPISFQGEMLAVVYADSDRRCPNVALPATMRASSLRSCLVRTAGVLVMRLSQELKMLNELRDYAAMLLQEAQEMYAPTPRPRRATTSGGRGSRTRSSARASSTRSARRSRVRRRPRSSTIGSRSSSTATAARHSRAISKRSPTRRTTATRAGPPRRPESSAPAARSIGYVVVSGFSRTLLSA